MSLTSDRCGQMSAITVIAPIVPGEEAALRTCLEDLHESPLAALAGTHFGRWVVVRDFTPGAGDRRPDTLAYPYLLFTATIDGPIPAYLEALAALPVAHAIWGHCIGCPDAAGLAGYLEHNRIETGLLFAASPDAPVAEVRRCLRTRERAIGLALRTQGMDAAAAQRAFLDEFALR
jgi:hypothetical protein